jgi:hypothetical protein
MSTIYSRSTTGLFNNGAGQLGDNLNFNWMTRRTDSGDYLSNGGSFFVGTNVYGSGAIGSQIIPVDTSKVYQLAYSVKTITRSYNNRLGSGHIGIHCLDEDGNGIHLQHQKGVGDTQLTRDASPGDTEIYVADGSRFSNHATYHQRAVNFFVGDKYPYSGGYTTKWLTWSTTDSDGNRIGAYSQNAITNIGGGEWRINLNAGLPDWGSDYQDSNGNYPTGTYVANARAGSTYHYTLGNPEYPESWTTFSATITGEARSSGSYNGFNAVASRSQFRYGTKAIKFLNLRNYNHRFEQDGDSARYVMDNLFFGEINSHDSALPESFLQSDRFR